VAVALTRPFDFEGQRKLEQADALIEALQVRVLLARLDGWRRPCNKPEPAHSGSRGSGHSAAPLRGRPHIPTHVLHDRRCPGRAPHLPHTPPSPHLNTLAPHPQHKPTRPPQDIAQLVVVVNQGILQQASKELTISQASTIADNTLEYTIRAILWSLKAPEVLVGAQGARLMGRPSAPAGRPNVPVAGWPASSLARPASRPPRRLHALAAQATGTCKSAPCCVPRISVYAAP
jgi:hypothetical protein